ncbi:MAG: MATE family efflux transporter [Muricoprocola sp.]
MNTRNKLAELPIRPLLYTMAVPLMLSLLVQSLYNIVDSIFVARLSETALTAASLVYSVQFLMIAVGVGTAVGLNALLSRKIGEHKPEEACQAATTGLFLMLLTSLFFSMVGIFLSDTIASKMTSDPELQALCRQYLSINLVYCWGIFLQTYGQRLLQAVGDTVLSMISLIIGAVLNIILDPIMIFGLFGCPAMGIRGAAIATVIGQMVGAIAALLFNRFRNPVIHVNLRNYHFRWQDVTDIYRVGLPTIIMQAIGSIMTFAVNSILLHISATAVAFFGIYYKLQNFLMMPINGLGQAAIPIVGYNYGEKNFQRVQQTWNILLPTGAVIALCGTIIFWCFPGKLLQLFSASQEMLALGIPALKIISVSFVLAAITILCGYFVSGLGNGMINMVSAAIRQLILLVPCLWIFIKILGISHGWYAFWIAESIACIYSYCTSHKLLKSISTYKPEGKNK